MKSSCDPRVADHPCYSEAAHHFFARMHLGVAPKCNIQCNYCNRKYDCSNESRPGVIAERLTPDEALKKVAFVASQVKELSVIGIAGPGDALANPEKTFTTMRLVKEAFPDLKLCLSTNGLKLLEYADEIASIGVEHVTVTLNTFYVEKAMEVYSWVILDRKKETSREAFEEFLFRQQEGIKRLVEKDVLVKVNSLLIPGINDGEMPTLSKKIKLMGAFMHNIMPLIAKAEHGTLFGLKGRPEPTAQELEDVRAACGDSKQMAHCRQCRADAVGKLGEDRFMEMGKDTFLKAEITEDGGLARREWKEKVEAIMERMKEKAMEAREEMGPPVGEYLIAACTKGMAVVNLHFGHAKEFLIYRVKGNEARLVNIRKVEQYCHGSNDCGEKEVTLENIIKSIEDCDAVVCLRVGYGPHKELVSRGVLPVTDVPEEPLEAAVVKAAERLAPSGRQKGKLQKEAINLGRSA
ncbi:MAG: nitrogenase cofactor biosynthesis protein NifB [Deltaproteobacteria bacterium]|nr:nitrogenase cofactor biosynthesis protein NifB [Deltaproteobacteria bacterium]